MKILLVGEYSSLHWTLAQGLIILGHDVTVASDGDGFKGYPRDIDLALKSNKVIDKLRCLGSILKNKNKLKGFDIVQIINPCFTRIHPINLNLYRFLKRHNKKIFLGAFGDDYYYTKMCLDNKRLRYNEFYTNNKLNLLKSNEEMKQAWLGSHRERANIEMAQSCNGIIACLYEYYVAYESNFSAKLTYVPLPINTTSIAYIPQLPPDILTFFIGINKVRDEVKGTTILRSILQDLHAKYPTQSRILQAESLKYDDYLSLMKQANVVVDQLYGYSPAMNGLQAMAAGKVLVGGGEPEMYGLLDEQKNRPIINITPDEEAIYRQLEKLILEKNRITDLSKESRKFVETHHDYLKVAKQYIDYWITCN